MRWAALIAAALMGLPVLISDMPSRNDPQEQTDHHLWSVLSALPAGETVAPISSGGLITWSRMELKMSQSGQPKGINRCQLTRNHLVSIMQTDAKRI